MIELLVVIAIVAILAAILFPVFVSVRNRARTTQCVSNLRQLSQAFRMYMEDNAGKMPYLGPPLSWTDTSTPPNWCGSQLCSGPVLPEKGSLWRYTRSRGLYLCPVDRGSGFDRYHVDPPYRANYALSYSANYMLQCYNVDAMRNRRPGRVLLLIHEDRQTINDGYLAWRDVEDDMPSAVHYNGTTMSYVDGHAQWLPYLELVARRASQEWDPNIVSVK